MKRLWWILLGTVFIGLVVQYEHIEIGEHLCSLHYGCYLKEVPFEQGMDIMPGQSTIAEFIIPMEFLYVL